jgi:hypothetical protein
MKPTPYEKLYQDIGTITMKNVFVKHTYNDRFDMSNILMKLKILDPHPNYLDKMFPDNHIRICDKGKTSVFRLSPILIKLYKKSNRYWIWGTPPNPIN